MKNLKFIILSLLSSVAYGQFKVEVYLTQPLGKEVILYKLDGSKYVIINSSSKFTNHINFKVDENYYGMMKLYWPESNQSVSFISENKEVEFDISADGNKIKNIIFKDSSNKLMKDVMDQQNKLEYIYPVLLQIQPYYDSSSDFHIALEKEITRLESEIKFDISNYPFVNYYKSNYKKYLAPSVDEAPVDKEAIIHFLSTSNQFLESSSLLRPILINYLNQSRNDIDSSVDKLLDTLQLDTPRGQTVLSEIIDLFTAYGMTSEENKYLEKAQGLQCSINERLTKTLNVHKKTEIGATFDNYTFTKRVSNTSAKTLYDIKANKKLIVFWSSGCGHCKKELPQLLENYPMLKSKNIEVIGLSLDTNETEYSKEIAPFPWINDTELRGWDSSFSETYNISGTPTYFILDSANKIIAKPSGVVNAINLLKK